MGTRAACALPARVLPRMLIVAAVAAGSLVHAGGRADADAGAVAPCTFAGTIAASNDTSSPSVALPYTLRYYGKLYNHVYVNNNGSVTFGAPAPKLTAFDNHAGSPPEIAPFAADVDTRGAASGITKYGTTTVNGHKAFCVDWGTPGGKGVGYFNGHTDALDMFQLLLVDAGSGNFDAMFNYQQLSWETGDAQGGSHGIGGSQPASAGFLAGDGNPQHLYAIRGSNESGRFLDAVGCSDSADPNVRRHGLAFNSYASGTLGRWAFHVVGGAPTMPIANIGGASVVEGDSGAHVFNFAVTLEVPSAAPVSLHYSVFKGAHDTATPGTDFLAVPDATVEVQPQVRYNCLAQTTVFLPVTVYGDTVPEADESFSVALRSAQGAALGTRALSRSTIINDDPATSAQHVDVNNAGIIEGDQIATPPVGTNKLCFTVTTSRPVPTGTTVKVHYDVVAGTATAGVDFDAVASSYASIAAGATQSPCILVGVHADTTVEPNETLQVRILGATNATIGQSIGVGTIRNDD